MDLTGCPMCGATYPQWHSPAHATVISCDGCGYRTDDLRGHSVQINQMGGAFQHVLMVAQCTCGWSARRTARDDDDVDRMTDQLERLSGTHLRRLSGQLAW